MKKRWCAVVVSMLMVGSVLAGCGSSSEAAPAAAPVAEAEAATEEVAEEAATEEVVTSTDEAVAAVSASLQKYIDQGYITVGTSNDAPISYVDTATGEWCGFDAKIFTEACKRLGIAEVKVEPMAWADLIVALNSGKIDMICDCMMIKPERVEQCYFSDYLYQNSELLVVPEDAAIESKADLTGKEVIGCTNGTTFLATAQEWETAGVIKEARPMGDQPELLLNVQTKKIDGCLTDAFVIEYMISLNSEEVAGLKACSNYTPEGAAGAGYACRFDDMDMMKELNVVFAEMRAEGTIDEVLESFGLSKELHGMTQEEAEHGLNTK